MKAIATVLYISVLYFIVLGIIGFLKMIGNIDLSGFVLLKMIGG